MSDIQKGDRVRVVGFAREGFDLSPVSLNHAIGEVFTLAASPYKYPDGSYCVNDTAGKYSVGVCLELAAQPTPANDFAAHLDAVLADIRALLLAKNAAYGDSATNPVRCFSKASPIEAINVRIDDKISRLMRGSAAGEDVAKDLLGYLVIREIATRMQKL